MKSFVTTLLILAYGAGLNAQKLVSAQYLGTNSPTSFVLFTNKAKYNVDTYKITYNTTDVDGSPTVASGAMAIPSTADCDSFPVMAYCHGTVLRKSDVPSRNTGEAIVAKVIASTGVIAVAPDYLGLGDNPGLHPYLHAESEATATIDLIRAAREFMMDSTAMTLKNEVYVTGYSQGGHAAMATAKYIQDNSLTTEFNLIAAGPASGPYNLSGSQAETLLSNQPYSNPGYVCYLLFAMNRVYGTIFQNYSDILKSPYDTLIPPLFDGTVGMGVVNGLLPDTISGFIHDSVLTNLRNDSATMTHPIWQALLANDNYDWTPNFPMELYYCTLDEQVNYMNAIEAETAMQANGAQVTAVSRGAFDHGDCFIPSMQASLNFFFSLSNGCYSIGLDENDLAGNLELYPNPARDHFTLSGFDNAIGLKVLDINGRELYNEVLRSDQSVYTGNWPAGIYVLEVSQGKLKVHRKLVVE